MRVMTCPFCDGGYPEFRISFRWVFPEAWLECPKCHSRTRPITCSHMNLTSPDVCMKDRRRLGRMWNRWQFEGVSGKVSGRR